MSESIALPEPTENRKIKTVRRQVYVEQMMIQGLTPLAMAHLKDSAGKVIASYETIMKDVKFIQTQWMLQDPEWMTRVNAARLIAKARLLDIQTKINDYLQRDDDTVSVKEKAGFLQLLQANTVKLYDVESDFDPEQYVNHLIMEKAEYEREQKKNLDESSPDEIQPQSWQQTVK